MDPSVCSFSAPPSFASLSLSLSVWLSLSLSLCPLRVTLAFGARLSLDDTHTHSLSLSLFVSPLYLVLLPPISLSLLSLTRFPPQAGEQLVSPVTSPRRKPPPSPSPHALRQQKEQLKASVPPPFLSVVRISSGERERERSRRIARVRGERRRRDRSLSLSPKTALYLSLCSSSLCLLPVSFRPLSTTPCLA